MILRPFFALAAAALAPLVLAQKVNDVKEVSLRQLNEDNFESSVAKGVWSTVWPKENNVKGYPQIQLYVDGKDMGEFPPEKRYYESLTTYINDEADKYAKTLKLETGDDGDASHVPNADGMVKEVDDDALEQLREEGPVLVKFFAPWCPHCKSFAPTYKSLAAEVKGKINIASVNCEDHRDACRRHDIQGYPTVKLLQGGKRGTSLEYSGARSISKIKKFLNENVNSNTMTEINAEQFNATVEENDAFFIFLQSFSTTRDQVRAVKDAVASLPANVRVFTSNDPALYRNLSIAQPYPESALLAFAGHDRKPVASMPLPTNQDKLDRFVFENRFPLTYDVTESMYLDVLKNKEFRPIVVMAALKQDATKPESEAELNKIARAWRKMPRTFDQPVWFATVNGDKWAKWLKRNYGMKAENMPGVVIIDSKKEEYYDTTLEGEPVKLEGAAIFSVLEGVYQKFLAPKKPESRFAWGTEGVRATFLNMITWMGENPIKAFFLSLFVLMASMSIAGRCFQRDRGALGGYMNEKGFRRGSNHERLD